jgi:hypothetical protein
MRRTVGQGAGGRKPGRRENHDIADERVPAPAHPHPRASSKEDRPCYPGIREMRNEMLRKHRFTLFSPV